MTKRKRVNELRWAIIEPDGDVVVCDRCESRRGAAAHTFRGDIIIRVRVTEVPEKKRKGKR